MSKGNEEVHFHLHVHEGADPDAVRAAVEAFRGHEVITPTSPSDDAVLLPGGRRPEYVRRAYLESEWTAKPLLEFLAENPERLIPYTEVSEALGFDSSRSLPGLLGSFSRRADHRYEGVQPFERRETLDGWHLYMSKEDAAIINAARGV